MPGGGEPGRTDVTGAAPGHQPVAVPLERIGGQVDGRRLYGPCRSGAVGPGGGELALEGVLCGFVAAEGVDGVGVGLGDCGGQYGMRTDLNERGVLGKLLDRFSEADGVAEVV